MGVIDKIKKGLIRGDSGPVNTVAPAITATAIVGMQINGDDGTWTGSPTFTYQWQRNTGSWVNIAGATNKNYTPVNADIGYPLRLQVTPNVGNAAVSNATNATLDNISNRILATQAANLFGYYPLGETSGTVADDVSATNANGTYTGGYTLDQAGIGDGSRSVLLNGTTGYIALPAAAALDTPFDGDVGTILIWAKVSSAGVWTNGVSAILFALGSGANNRLSISKNSSNNELIFLYRANSTNKLVLHSTFSPTDFFSVALTWDRTGANQMKAYVNGVQTGATQTALPTWAGALSNSWSGIGSLDSAAPSSPAPFYLAHAAAWNKVLSAAEILNIGAV